MKKLLVPSLAFASVAFVACASGGGKHSSDSQSGNHILVAYFSAEGHTKALAGKIAAVTGGDLFEIQPEVPYTAEDLDGWNDSSRATLEARNRTTRPGIANKVENFAQYDTIYLGFPIWWYTAPTIINTFLESYDTAGKTIIPFATSGGSTFGNTETDLRVSAPDARFKPGRVLNNATDKQLADWLKSVSR